jgi:hypothetical protein
MTDTTFYRIEELENALEGLLECFDRSFEGRPWIEVEVEGCEHGSNGDAPYTIIEEGQVNQITADAIAIAEEVLYQDEAAGGDYEE